MKRPSFHSCLSLCFNSNFSADYHVHLKLFEQLKLERREERVFKDWQEGPIYFPPTYKYKEGTDRFSGETSSTGEKRRSPAWQVPLFISARDKTRIGM